MSNRKDDGGYAAFPAVHAATGHNDVRYISTSYGMTLRQYAAIKLRVPNSGTDWLDDMIRKSLRMELAGKAMPALIEALADSEMAEEEMRNLGLGEREFDLLIAKCAFDYARAVIKQWGKS